MKILHKNVNGMEKLVLNFKAKTDSNKNSGMKRKKKSKRYGEMLMCRNYLKNEMEEKCLYLNYHVIFVKRILLKQYIS